MAVTATGITQGPPLTENPDLHWQIRQDRERYRGGEASVKDIVTFRRYARGSQPNNLTVKQKETLAGLVGNKFSDNVCDSIIRQARGRLLMQEFTAEDQATKDYLDTVYKYCAVRQRSGEIHYDSLRDGNMVVAGAWNNLKKRVQLTMEPWWDGEEGVYIAYDFDGNPVYGVKDWKEIYYANVTQKDRKNLFIIYRNLYWPDRLERWKSLNGGTTWEPRPLSVKQPNGSEKEEPWPIPWVKKDTTPLGIPYVHFLNAGRGSGFYGWSELDSGVLGFQDQINDLQWALSGAGRLTAFQIYWIAGVQPDTEAKVSPGGVWKFTKSDTKVGVLAPADMTQLLKILEFKLARVSQMTDTPLHYITGGDWPSGEALLRAEQPAVAKAEVQIDRFQPAWGEVAVMAVKLSNRFGGTNFPEDADDNSISSSFASPERRDPLSKSVIVMNLGDKISDEESLRMMDFDDEKIKQITEEKDAKQKKQQDLFTASFNRGVGPGTALPGRGPTPGPGGPTPPKPGFAIPKGPGQVPKPPVK